MGYTIYGLATAVSRLIVRVFGGNGIDPNGMISWAMRLFGDAYYLSVVVSDFAVKPQWRPEWILAKILVADLFGRAVGAWSRLSQEAAPPSWKERLDKAYAWIVAEKIGTFAQYPSVLQGTRRVHRPTLAEFQSVPQGVADAFLALANDPTGNHHDGELSPPMMKGACGDLSLAYFLTPFTVTNTLLSISPLSRDRPSLWVRPPFRYRPHCRCATARIDDRRFERLGRPALDGLRHDRALGGAAEHVERGRAVAGRVGMEADPAVGCGIVSGDRVPGRRQRPSDRLYRHREPERGQSAVDDDRRRVRNCGNELGNRQRRRANRGGGERRHGEGGGKTVRALEPDTVGRCARQPERLDGCAEEYSIRAVIFGCFGPTMRLIVRQGIHRPPAKGSAKHVALLALNQS